MDDNSALEITLEADNKVWWTIIDADDSALLALIACKTSAKVTSQAYRHLEVVKTKTWNFELPPESVLNVTCAFWGKLGPIIERLRYCFTPCMHIVIVVDVGPGYEASSQFHSRTQH